VNIEQAYHILDDAITAYQPRTVIALTSWGHDSQVSTHLADRWRRERNPNVMDFRVYTLDTGLSADGYIPWVQARAREAGYPFRVWEARTTHGLNWYLKNARTQGFGYTRAMHSLYYRMLKERTIRRMRAFWHRANGGRVLFVTGIYRAESAARANADVMSRDGNTCFVSPLIHWCKRDIAAYRVAHDLPQNPFYETTGGSGDCMCNWGQFVTFDELQATSPQLAAKIEPAHRDCIDRHGWGYGEAPSDGLLAEREGQLVLPGVEPLAGADLCAGCQRVKPGQSEVEAYRMLQEWGA